MKKYKFILILFLFFPILVFATDVPGLYRFNISPTQAVINAGESVGINVDAWVYGSNVANNVTINMGNGQSSSVSCTGGHNCSGVTSPVNYSVPGTYMITATLCYLDSSGLGTICVPPKPFGDSSPCCMSETAQVIVTGSSVVCVPDNCNGICPVGCTVAEDPDCGCLDGDGCCGIGCDSISDDDCPLGVSRYRNALTWDDIITFIWAGIISIFSQSIVLVVLMILIGAYVIATSGGNIKRVQLGKRIIIWTLIGYTVILLARGIIMFIINAMGS